MEDFGSWMMVKKQAWKKNPKPNSFTNKARAGQNQTQAKAPEGETRSECNNLNEKGKNHNHKETPTTMAGNMAVGSRYAILEDFPDKENPEDTLENAPILEGAMTTSAGI